MSTTSKALAALLVLQLALLGGRALSSHGAGAGAAASDEGTPVVTGVTAGQVARVKIVDAQGTSIELARGGDGWVVASAGDFPCKVDPATKASSVEKMIDKVLGLRSLAVAGTSKATQAALDVSEGRAQRDVRLLDGGGKELARLLLGRSVAGGAFVRRAGAEEVLRVGENITWDVSTSPATYIDTQLTSFDPASATSITISRAAGETIALEKGEKDAWRVVKPADFDADKAKAEDVVRAASRIAVARPAATTCTAQQCGLEPGPEVAIEVKLKDGTTQRVELGTKTADGASRYARKAGAKHIVEVAPYAIQGILDKNVEAFKPAPPAAPAPGAPPAPGSALQPPGGAPPIGVAPPK
jgi:hypothetical protein